MYNVHQGATLLPVSVKSDDYILGNEKLPAISISASKDKSGLVHISLVNIDAEKPSDITVDIEGSKFSSVTGRVLASAKIQDHNDFANADKVKPVAFSGARINGKTLSVKMPPASVVVLELK